MTILAGFCGGGKHLVLDYLGPFFHWSGAYSPAKRGRSVSHRPWFDFSLHLCNKIVFLLKLQLERHSLAEGNLSIPTACWNNVFFIELPLL
ncbi:hypothetical protein C9994_04910 [Marivirga lumbricoides]|uniref:Uncharacterized protein n=1 Tax=Marivirga lumbricoides TaxID=1046115 RepID=A0A2T4DT33_9BACT|nr:hypothetical protein C9994_04910 [Marivirga lumbricoides]